MQMVNIYPKSLAIKNLNADILKAVMVRLVEIF